MQKGLELLLNKYSVTTKAVLGKDGKSVEIDGKKFPLLPFESERRFIELRNLVLAGRVGNMCTYRIGHTTKSGSDLFELLAKEIGILEFTVNSKAKEIFTIKSNSAMNSIIETENGCVCTIELGATLKDGEKDVDKHEIITDNGVACDMVVDTQTMKESIYVMGKNNQVYTDTDTELYGYSTEQVCIIRNAFALAKDSQLLQVNTDKCAHIQKVVECAKKSIETLSNVRVEG